MAEHGISWLNALKYNGESLNITSGCTKTSEGCQHCYAEAIAKRFWGGRRFSDIRLHPERAEKPLHWRKPRFIFIDSMSDLFHQEIVESIDGLMLIRRMLDVMRETPRHRYIILTKRPQNAVVFQESMERRGETWPDNLILGVSCSNQEDADKFIPALLKLKVKTRAVSLEPLLGPIDLSLWIKYLHWVIPGGESGTNARPMHPDWVRSVRDQCEDAGVAFYFKQWGQWYPLTRTDGIHESPFGGQQMMRIGRKKAGHFLDGVEYHEFPEVLR